MSFESNLTPGVKSQILINSQQVEIQGAESKNSALLVVVADPKTRIILESKSFDVNLENCDSNDNCFDYRGE